MARITLKFLLPLALTGAAVAIAACGNDVPPGAVAKVGDTEITQEQFDKWMAIATKGQAQGGPAANSATMTGIEALSNTWKESSRTTRFPGRMTASTRLAARSATAA